MSACVAECPFCIGNGKVTIIADTRDAYLTPVRVNGVIQPGRFFVIPKAHIKEAQDLPANWWGTITTLLLRVPELTVGKSWNLTLNQGEDAGQKQEHMHFWIVLRDPASEGLAARLGFSALIAAYKRFPKASFWRRLYYLFTGR